MIPGSPAPARGDGRSPAFGQIDLVGVVEALTRAGSRSGGVSPRATRASVRCVLRGGRGERRQTPRPRMRHRRPAGGRLRPGVAQGLLGAGHRVDVTRPGGRGREVLRLRAKVGNLVSGDRVTGPSGSRRTGWRPGSGVAPERGIRVPGLRALIGGVRVAGIAVAVVVDGRLLIDRSGAVRGLEHVPGLRVKLTETLRPGDLGAERHLAPSAGAFARVVAWPRSLGGWTARGLIRVRTLRGWPWAIWSRRTTPHIPGHSPVVVQQVNDH